MSIGARLQVTKLYAGYSGIHVVDSRQASLTVFVNSFLKPCFLNYSVLLPTRLQNQQDSEP